MSDYHRQSNHRTDGAAPPAAKVKSPRRNSSVLDLLAADDPLRKEMEQLLAKDKTAAPSASPERVSTHTRTAPVSQHQNGQALEAAAIDENALRKENLKLRNRLKELEKRLQANGGSAEQISVEQLREYETLLEEKSEMIRKLHKKLQAKGSANAGDAKNAGSEQPPKPTATRDELAVLQEKLECEREQLEEDERSLMEQARQMEMAMSKERVELARQKNELQRMHHQLQHEIEMVTRDGALRDRLLNITRQKQEADAADQESARPRRAQPTQRDLSRGGSHENNGGILGKIFGK